jgi:iron(III) transport system ATP-binding protein
MTVFDNVAYPLKGNADKATIKERSMRALELVGLDHLASRRAPNLSGGQQQRVALARALVAQPEVLLLDEPLSNLDAKLRDQMRKEIRELQKTLGITTLYVTHDQSEALAISDFVAVMSQGHIVDFGEPERIYSRPASRSVAEFIGMANVVELSGLRGADGTWVGESQLGPISIEQEGRPPATCSVLIRLEDLRFVGEAEAGRPNVWPGRVVSAIYLGSFWECEIEVAGQRLRTHVPRRQRPAEGQTVHVEVPPDRLYLLPEDDRGPVQGIGGEEGDEAAEKSA